MVRSVVLLALAVLSSCVLCRAELSPEETLFVDTTSAAGARAHLQYYTSLAHVAGTPGDYDTAQYTLAQFTAAGIAAEILPFKTLINYPDSRSLTMISPLQYNASLSEDIYPADPTSDTPWRNLTFHGYGASGDVTAPVVYVNYGSASDFAYLASVGVDIAGKIALVRYGQVFRGLKVQNAQYAGAVGCLIYSDPADDGFTKGPVYDEGPWRPSSGVQRGSVQFLSRCSGDPGFVERDPEICGGYTTDELIPQIPSLPLSYGDALPLLQSMSGVSPPSAWVGGLNVSYGLGVGPATVRLFVNDTYEVATLWNVVATIPGSHPDPAVAQQQVILGNHRDAWVFGSTDPNSGTAALMEIAAGFGALLASGWKSDRTIKLCSWDGEEFGLLGSVNYAESHAKELQQFAVMYLNVDVAVTGPYLGVSASPSVANLALSVTKDLIDPNTNLTLYQAWANDSAKRAATQPTTHPAIQTGLSAPEETPTPSAVAGSASVPTVGILGSGSDFASFLHHIGVSSLDMGFNGDYGVYHSVYDSFFWTENFGDPTFAYHRAMAQLWGVMAIRLASSRVLPFSVPDYAAALVEYMTTIQAAASAASMPLDFSAMSAAVSALQSPAAIVECYRVFAATTPTLPAAEVSELNSHLARLEQAFLITPDDGFDGNGLPGRTWFKHIVQAPGLNTGYDANVFPSLFDAIDQRNTTAAQAQIGLLTAKLSKVLDVIGGIAPYVPQGCTW